MPSKKIKVLCNRPFVHSQIRSEEALEQLGLARKSIGSYFANRHSNRKGSGLTEEEIDVLLPILLNLSEKSQDFRREVDKYYTEINTNIPYREGIELEIGLTISNEKPVTYFKEEEDPSDATKKIKVFNLPLVLEDYIKYRHIKGHPYTAQSPKSAKGNSTIMFYIEDPDETLRDNVSDSDMQDAAMNLYVQIKDDDRKMRAVLTILQNLVPKKPGELFVPELLGPEARRLRVRELAQGKYYKQFYKTATDPNVWERFQLIEMIRFSLLKRAGTSILVAESNELLGGNEEEALTNLWKNPANAQLLELLKGQAKAKSQTQAIGR
jgi:hypothetical protein